MIEFIKGKWYKITNYEGSYHFFKYNSKEVCSGYNRIECIDLIWNKKYKSPDAFANTDAEKSAILLTDLSEIQEYLPENHIDKIIIHNIKEEMSYLIPLLSKLNIK